MTASYEELQAQIRELTVAAAAARKAELDQALNVIRDLIQQYDLTQDDVLALFRKRRGRPAAGANVAPATKGVAKYRDPDTGLTWTGRGKPPSWIKDASDRSVFLIEGGSAPASKKTGRRGATKRAPAAKRAGRKKAAA
jgi:DNA-binding protein H-NS